MILSNISGKLKKKRLWKDSKQVTQLWKDSRIVRGLDVKWWQWEWGGNTVDVWDEKLLFKVTPNFKTEKLSDTINLNTR